MAELKTRKTAASPAAFIARQPDEATRRDCTTLVRMMEKVTGEKAAMWGPGIVGFGSDHYVFNVAPGEENADLVFGFTKDESEGFDKIVLDSGVMTELGAAGQLAADDERWHSAAGATGGAEEDDRIVYDSEAGRLYYDADGSGAGEAQLIATVFVLNENPVVASDIIIV